MLQKYKVFHLVICLKIHIKKFDQKSSVCIDLCPNARNDLKKKKLKNRNFRKICRIFFPLKPSWDLQWATKFINPSASERASRSNENHGQKDGPKYLAQYRNKQGWCRCV